jgi:hypothetical protein
MSELDTKPRIKVVMLGPTGSGKTSLLASMYDTFPSVIGATDLQLSPDDSQTRITLDKYVLQLRTLARKILVKGDEGITGSNQIRRHLFGLGRQGKQPLLGLQIIDYPGRTLVDTTDVLRKDVEEFLAQADVIVLAIHAPALMERDRQYHDQVNHPQLMTDEVGRILQSSQQPRLLVLAPLKCEKYLATSEDAKRLAEMVRLEYGKLLGFISHQNVRDRVACVLAPVQTVGSIELHDVTETGGALEFRYRKRRKDSDYNPVDADQPLRYILRFAIAKYRRHDRGAWRGFWQKLGRTDSTFGRAAESFTSECKSDAPFEIIQDHELLGPRG